MEESATGYGFSFCAAPDLPSDSYSSSYEKLVDLNFIDFEF
jgi:hypothetical protein